MQNAAWKGQLHSKVYFPHKAQALKRHFYRWNTQVSVSKNSAISDSSTK